MSVWPSPWPEHMEKPKGNHTNAWDEMGKVQNELSSGALSDYSNLHQMPCSHFHAFARVLVLKRDVSCSPISLCLYWKAFLGNLQIKPQFKESDVNKTRYQHCSELINIADVDSGFSIWMPWHWCVLHCHDNTGCHTKQAVFGTSLKFQPISLCK